MGVNPFCRSQDTADRSVIWHTRASPKKTSGECQSYQALQGTVERVRQLVPNPQDTDKEAYFHAPEQRFCEAE